MDETTALKLSYEVIPSEGYLTIKLTGFLETEAAKALLEKAAGMLETPMHIIVACEHSDDIGIAGIRTLLALQQKIKAAGKHLRLIGMSANLRKLFKHEGVDTTLKAAASLRAALVEFGLMSAQTLDVNFINPFLEATLKVLETQAQTRATAGKPYKKEDKNKFAGDISGVIALVSDAFSGAVIISFPKDTFLKIMSRMLGEECTSINKEIEDGAAELTNIIFGQAKVILNEKGYGLRTAIPSVICGDGHSVSHTNTGPLVIIPFESDIGKFFVEICLSA